MGSRAACVVVLAVAAAGCGGGPDRAAVSGDGPDITRGSLGRDDGIQFAIPDGWRASRRSLTPHLVNPRELLTVGTGRLPAGGGCSQFPSAALRAMRAGDVLVTVQERFGSPESFVQRPRHFRLYARDTRNEAQQCAGSRPAFTSYWFGFRDGGRGFHVLVAVGRAARASRVRDALGVLDSIRVTPRPPVRIDGDEAIPYDDDARRLSFVAPDSWQLYRRALTEAVPARSQLALGTFTLNQRQPDPNCSPVTAQRTRQAHDGFLFLFEYENLNPRQLARFPNRPPRLRLPRSSFQPYECMDRSWLVRFRDGGRAFQAHVYGPSQRRREALAILDSLRVRAG